MERMMTSEQLVDLLKNCYHEREKFLQEKFGRSLPFQDAMFDRWERAEKLGFGNGASVYNSSAIFGKVSVGKNSWIGPNTILDGSGAELTIGSYCSVSAGVHIYTHDTVLWALSMGELDKHVASVTIGDAVYIGSQSVIAAGTSIGTRCVIAANSFVSGNVPDGTVFGGSPARQLGVVTGFGVETRIEFFKIRADRQ